MGEISESQFLSWLGPAYVKLLDDGRVHASLAAQHIWNAWACGNGYYPWSMAALDSLIRKRRIKVRVPCRTFRST